MGRGFNFYFLFHGRENRVSEQFGSLPQITQLVRGKARTDSWMSLVLKSVLYTVLFCAWME